MKLSRPLMLVLVFASLAYSQETFKFGTPVPAEIKAGTNNVHSLELPAGKTVGIQVNQKGLDVIVRVYAPNKQKLAGVDAPTGEKGAETLWFITAQKGEYKIEIEPYDGKSGGPYEVVLLFIRSTIPQDRQVIESQKQLQNSYNNLADALETLNETGVIGTSPSSGSKAKSSGSKSRSNSGPVRASSAPAGATAECRDGTFSFSQNRRGTCSHHGGVRRWL